MIRFIKKFTKKPINFFADKNVFVIEFFILDEIFKIKNNDFDDEKSQISDFLFKFFDPKIRKVKINSESISGEISFLKSEIDDFFYYQKNLFDSFEKTDSQILLLNFSFDKDLKNKNMSYFLDFLGSKIQSQNHSGKKILILKEVNFENKSFETSRLFENFLSLIKSNNFGSLRVDFGIKEKKQIIDDFFENIQINEYKKKKIIDILISKNLFFIENEFLKIQLNPEAAEKILNEILNLNKNYKIFEIFNLILNKNLHYQNNSQFLFLIDEFIQNENHPISLIRALTHFLLENRFFLEKNFGHANFLLLLERAFEFEIFIKTSEFYNLSDVSKQSWQRKFFIEFLKFS
jgi:hypothetical protein